MKIERFNPVIYPRILWVATGEVNEVTSKFEYSNGDPIILKEKGYFGVTLEGIKPKDEETIGVLIYIRHAESVAQLIHEAVHAADIIFNDLGISFNLNDDEHYAYFVQWVCDCILHVVNVDGKYY